jgi:uncharacterized protein YbjT (DUF2867 family)
MQRVLVTGGTGGLGREVVGKLAVAGYTVRVMSRRPRPDAQDSAVEWARADLTSGDGLREAVADVHTIVHTATNSPLSGTKLTDAWFGRVDIDGTKRLLDHAREAGVVHVVYISIVGIDRVPFIYYRQKLQAEAFVQASGIPWSILRATQFHSLIDAMLRRAIRLPIALLPTDFQFQPVDTHEVADRLAESVAVGPGGRLPDLGGPQAHTLGGMAKVWMTARGLSKRVVRLPLPGKFATALRRGALLCPGGERGAITWAEWVEETYMRRGGGAILNLRSTKDMKNTKE